MFGQSYFRLGAQARLTTGGSRRPFGELQKRAQDPSTAIVPYVDKSDNFLMREAAKCGNVLELTRLLGRGVPVERKSTKNRSPLMDACAGGHVDAVEFLLRCGADAERSREQRWCAEVRPCGENQRPQLPRGRTQKPRCRRAGAFGELSRVCNSRYQYCLGSLSSVPAAAGRPRTEHAIRNRWHRLQNIAGSVLTTTPAGEERYVEDDDATRPIGPNGFTHTRVPAGYAPASASPSTYAAPGYIPPPLHPELSGPLYPPEAAGPSTSFYPEGSHHPYPDGGFMSTPDAFPDEAHYPAALLMHDPSLPYALGGPPPLEGPSMGGAPVTLTVSDPLTAQIGAFAPPQGARPPAVAGHDVPRESSTEI